MKTLILSITLIASTAAHAEWLGWAPAGGATEKDWQSASMTEACQAEYGGDARVANSTEYLRGTHSLALPDGNLVFGYVLPTSFFGAVDQATGLWLQNINKKFGKLDYERGRPAGHCMNFGDRVMRVDRRGRIQGVDCGGHFELYAGCAE